MSEMRGQLERAIQRSGRASSDFDLNAETDRPVQSLRDAAVLIPIVERDEPWVILTKRSSALKHHPGQIAFPGGKVEEADNGVFGAALRETEEEISVRADQIDVVGQLAPHETVTGFKVTPVLALVAPDYEARPDPSEVAEVFEVPLAHLMDTGKYLIESRRWRGQRRYFFTIPWGPYYVWGATARMLRALADRMDGAN